jgi:hypothetical protein
VLVAVGCGPAGGSTGAAGQTAPASLEASAAPLAEASAAPLATVSPDAPPAASPAPSVRASLDELPTRIIVKALDIDLPVVSGDLDLPGNPPDYPLCDVAQYLTTYPYPARPGTTTWIYGHARKGMFLPLLEASQVDQGASLIGQTVLLETDAGRRFEYLITDVHRHATDRSSARDVPAGEGRLVLQTSEGPRGTVPKLQVVAELVGVEPSALEDSSPAAEPRGCYIP